MKVKFLIALIILLALVFPTIVYSDSNNLGKITGLKESFKLSEKVSFKVESSSQEDQNFICNIEKLIDSEWHEILYDCEANSPMKGTRLYSLASQASEAITWEPQKEKYIKISYGTYRFRLDFEGEPYPAKFLAVIYSDTFKLE